MWFIKCTWSDDVISHHNRRKTFTAGHWPTGIILRLCNFHDLVTKNSLWINVGFQPILIAIAYITRILLFSCLCMLKCSAVAPKLINCFNKWGVNLFVIMPRVTYAIFTYNIFNFFRSWVYSRNIFYSSRKWSLKIHLVTFNCSNHC